MKNQKVAIVGGTGMFGQHLGKKIETDNQILISGRTEEAASKVGERHGWEYGRNTEIVKEADTVIVAVPISATEEVIHEVGPHVPEDALFSDITSVKQKPVEAMKKYSEEVLGMHPMYAPTNSIEGQKIVMCPEKGDEWRDMRDFWREHGADLHFTDPESHDEAMSLIQGLMHFSELVVADVIRRKDFSDQELDQFSSPVYKLITDLTARMLNQKPELYGSIQRENPENKEIRKMFLDSAEEMKKIVEDEKEFNRRFEQLGESFDLEEAQNTTDEVIEFLSDQISDD
jgi:prephenate dehydrogenase